MRDGEFLVAIDLVGPDPGKGLTARRSASDQPDSRVRMASIVEREWLVPTGFEVQHRLDAEGTVRAMRLVRYDALVLETQPAPVDPAVAADLLVAAWMAQADNVDAPTFMRLRFAGLAVNAEQLVRAAAHGKRSLSQVDPSNALEPGLSAVLDRQAPTHLVLPSGRRVELAYRSDGTVYAAAKLQELFGWADIPRLGPNRVPVVIELLAPNGRPVQVTSDLRSFWNRTYPDVRRELRGRYPRHPWPEDPWTAQPTARTLRRIRKA